MRNKLIVLLLMSILLTGCVAGVIVGTTSLAVYDKRGVVTLEKDARIFHVIHTALVKDPRLKGSRMEVTSFNRIVLLVGQTPSASLRVLAEKIAQSTPGVIRVYNEITIGEPLRLTARPRDSWITAHIRSKMLTKKGLESGSIRVVTEDGIVYLMGLVTKEQAELATDVARNVNGVQKVVKIFQYIR